MEAIQQPTGLENPESGYQQQSSTTVEGQQPIPFLLEFSFTISKILIILTGTVIAGLSWYRGADLLNIGLRSGTAVLTLGIFLWAVNSVVCNNAIDIARNIQKPANNPENVSGEDPETAVE